jgi:hypothetical protein
MAKKKERPEWHTSLTPGECYSFTDATSMIYVGRLVRVDGPYVVVLDDAAWVSETGRLSVFMRTGVADGMQIEPVGVRTVHWVGWSPWSHKLFREAV